MKKKAVSLWISYVLLIGFVLALAAFVYLWMTSYTRQSVEDVKERVYDTELCSLMGISLDACINSSTSQNLYINITNRGDLRTTGLIFRFMQLSNYSVKDLFTVEVGSVIAPQRSRNFNATQLNLTWSVDSSTKVEVVPETTKDNFIVVCTDRKGEALFRNC